VWRYCEDSARWIFETGTGNKNADRILAAVKAAGENGLTKCQITNEVFNRNATKFDIDEALRFLHELNLAACTQEATGDPGRPVERWFYKAQRYEENEENTPEGSKAGNTSFSSCPQPSEKAASGGPETESVPVAVEDTEGEV
jgi:hypothetical protein